MPIVCQLRVLLARLNLRRAELGMGPVSLRRLASESGVSLSVVVALHTGRSQRVDFATLDRLLRYFNAADGALAVSVDDLLAWKPAA